MAESTARISSSVSVIEKKDFSDTHFRWDSLKKFLYLANAFSNHVHNFDIFSKISSQSVRIFEFVLMQILVGMPYMFMDGFIKQYTRRIDGFKFLNPLLKGISFGQFLQTGFWAIIQSAYLADAVRYLAMTLNNEVPWAHCSAESTNSTCLSISTMFVQCNNKEIIQMEVTAAHHLYLKTFSSTDRTAILARCCIVAMVWLTNFFVSSVTDENIVKMFGFTFIFRSISTLVIEFILIFSVESESMIALIDILDARSPCSIPAILTRVTYAYGVGFLGFYDFGTVSPYTMVDTAVIIFSVIFTLLALIRSWIIKVLFIKMTSCVKVGLSNPHYFVFAIIPLSTEFVWAHKLYAFYIYLNIIITILGYLTMQTLTMSKLLHSEFRSLKNIYLVGLICCCGFTLTLPVTVQMSESSRIRGIIAGLNMTVFYLGGFKVAIIMWVYGVEQFSTDIQFWLGFKPTRYWTLSWALMPLFCLVVLIYKFYAGFRKNFVEKIGTFSWFTVTVLVVAISHIRTISKYLVRNNLASLFLSTIKYGPPDPVDRRHRRNYSETIQRRRCKHNCQVIDDLIDCNHIPQMTSVMESETSSMESLTRDIYKAESTIPGTSIKNLSYLDLEHRHF